ncbi:hypothetical protein [Arthrospiribacter ruber]|uniref:Uncharacterized protein n=1 Tax=Arthrospiribacter ruber TaxID=2487934 RepID=A0A951MHT2_9BACT|nr:hypothetical protein [Arthrospiribacter ruber]MBW3470035.1 hypothetical protein [Arthrospiribacter ruber]
MDGKVGQLMGWFRLNLDILKFEIEIMNINGGTLKGIYNPENIDHFKFVLMKLSVVVDDFAKDMVGSGKALNLPQQVFNKLLLRTRSNLVALICLLDVYKEQSFIFHSI